MQRSPILAVASLLILAGSCVASRGADVLQHVPKDALCFMVVRKLGATDARFRPLCLSLQLGPLGPLDFLRAVTGIGYGLDREGDFLLVALPGDVDADGPEYCVWLPVAHFSGMVASLGGMPNDEIGPPNRDIFAINVGGEDLLVANQGGWALFMDRDQRHRMEQILAADPATPARAAAWQKWIETNNVSVVALAGGVRSIVQWASPANSSASRTGSAATDDIFGLPGENGNASRRQPGTNDDASAIETRVRGPLRTLLKTSPPFVQSMHELEAVGCGLQLDGRGNALARIRAVWPAGSEILKTPRQESPDAVLPATMYDGGPFTICGAGEMPPAFVACAASSYIRLIVAELKTQERIRLEDKTVARFLQSVEQAASEVTSASVLTLPGEKQDGVYTHNYVVVRAASADTFVDLAAEAMRLWNQMNRDAQGGPRLVFDVAEVPIGKRTATEYSLDIAAADGAPVIPEVRQAMEKLFGPGGTFRLLFVKVDGNTALLAAATAEQAAAVLDRVDRKQPIDWNKPPTDVANRLLPEQADWRVYFSPHGYTSWLTRQMDAIVGVPVIGGPLVKEFPPTPPIGAAGGFRDSELWIEFAVTMETIRGAGAYRHNRRAGLP